MHEHIFIQFDAFAEAKQAALAAEEAAAAKAAEEAATMAEEQRQADLLRVRGTSIWNFGLLLGN